MFLDDIFKFIGIKNVKFSVKGKENKDDKDSNNENKKVIEVELEGDDFTTTFKKEIK